MSASASMWVSERVCVDTREYFELVCQAVAEARHSVLLEMYIFQYDQLGKRLLENLRIAASRGVSVRLIVDGVGSPHFNHEFLQLLGRQRISARIYHPTPNIFNLLGAPSLRRLRNFFSSVNKRNHRKLIVVDESVAFVGSCNVSDRHQGWRETAVQVRGIGIRELCRSFELIWSRSSHPDLPRTTRIKARLQARRGDVIRNASAHVQAEAAKLVRMNYTRRLRVANNSALASQIAQAGRRVWITNAYFVPSPAILAALLRATRNGCDVKLLLPGKSDVGVVSLVSRMFYRSLIMAGVKIYEYQPSVLHAKTLLIDEWACVGTTNLNHRSFYHDLEVDVALHDDVSRELLVSQFEADLAVSRQVSIDHLSQRSYLERLGGYLIYPFRSFI